MEIDGELVIIVTSATFGEAEPDLGQKLTESFFEVLSDSELLPARIIFINSGVFLTTEGSPVVTSLQKLQKGGVEILSCTTCLNYFQKMDKILVGGPGNMRDTVETITRKKRVVTL